MDYIASLRQHVGSAPLIMPCAGCAVVNDGQVLLQQRQDGSWGLPGGAMELGESIQTCAIRETLEETGLHVEPVELLGVYTGPEHIFDNGDVVFSVVTVLVARVGRQGDTAGLDAETLCTGWYHFDLLPQLIFAPHRQILDDLVSGRRGVWV